MRQTTLQGGSGRTFGALWVSPAAGIACSQCHKTFPLVCRDGKVFTKHTKGKTSIGTGFKRVRYFAWLEMRRRVLKPTIIEIKKKNKIKFYRERCLQRDVSCLTTLMGFCLRRCFSVN
jgi:hypothetical protein